MAKSTKAAIYAIYLLILLSAVGWRVAKAYSGAESIYDLAISETDNQTSITFLHTKGARAAVEFSGEDACLRLCFNNCAVSGALIKKAFTGNSFKALFFSKTDERKSAAKALLYFKREFLASIKQQEDKTIVKLIKNENYKTKPSELRALLPPFEEAASPIAIALANAPLAPVLNELARLSKIDLRLSKDLPSTFSGHFKASAPLEAIKQIVSSNGLELIKEQKTWLVKPKKRLLSYDA